MWWCQIFPLFDMRCLVQRKKVIQYNVQQIQFEWLMDKNECIVATVDPSHCEAKWQTLLHLFDKIIPLVELHCQQIYRTQTSKNIIICEGRYSLMKIKKEKVAQSIFHIYLSRKDQKTVILLMNGKLVETSMGCLGVSKETVANIEVSWYTVWWKISYWRFKR